MGERLRKARMAAGFKSAKAAADRMGISGSTYAAHENGQNEFDATAAAIYGRAFGVTASWLLTGEGAGPVERTPPPTPAPQGLDVPEIRVRGGMGGGGVAVDHWISDGRGGHVAADDVRDVWRVPAGFLRHELRVAPSDVQIIEVMGNSMEPTLKPGDRVMIDTSHKHPSPDGVYALFDGMGVIVKSIKYIMGSDPVRIKVISDNPIYGSEELILDGAHIIGRVVCKVSAM